MVMMMMMMMMLTRLKMMYVWSILIVLLSMMDRWGNGRMDGRTDTLAYWDAIDASKDTATLF